MTFTSGKTIVFALGLCGLFGAATANAQSYRIRVDVPFQFLAGEKMYPAGNYFFTVDPSVHTLRIQSQNTTKISMVPLIPGVDWRSSGEAEKGLARFTQAGDVSVLSAVFKAGSEVGNVPYPSKAAKQALANAMPQTGDTPSGNGQNLP